MPPPSPPESEPSSVRPKAPESAGCWGEERDQPSPTRERRSSPFVGRSPGLSWPLALKPPPAFYHRMPRKPRVPARPRPPHPAEPRVIDGIQPGAHGDDVWGLFAEGWEGWEPVGVPEEQRGKPIPRRRPSKP